MTFARWATEVDDFSAARADANGVAYQRDVTSNELLKGGIPPPQWADLLIQRLLKAIGDFTPDDDALSETFERVSINGPNDELLSRSIDGAPNQPPEGDLDRGQKKAMSSSGGSAMDRRSVNTSSRREGSPARSDPAPPGQVDQEIVGLTGDVNASPWKEPPSGAMQEILGATRSSRGPSSRSIPPRPALPPAPQQPSVETRSSIPKAQTIPEPTPESLDPLRSSVTRIDRPLPTDDSNLTPSNALTIPGPAPEMTEPFESHSLVERHDRHSLSTGNLDPTSAAEPHLAGKAVFDQVRASTPIPADQWDGESDLSEGESVVSSRDRPHKLPVKHLSDSRNTPKMVKAVAVFDFFAEEDADLSFRAGDEIYVFDRTENTDDWWTGMVAGQASCRGIFPANYVELEV
ncbi:hypothetical protein FS837_010531 [Tulasnella sp. UAMH 9824]|nr:hypothetical protein FS837_010531 [Tulasnella sp. UAMH 9824]